MCPVMKAPKNSLHFSVLFTMMGTEKKIFKAIYLILLDGTILNDVHVAKAVFFIHHKTNLGWYKGITPSAG